MRKSNYINRTSFFIISFLFIQLFNGCSGSRDVYYEIPKEFRNPQKKIEFIEKYTPYIKNKIIFIDPGHGGEDRRNIGFEGDAIEADINLNVALALTTFLRQANAVVFLSRDKDTTVALQDRSRLADSFNADILISIHHNAPAIENDIWTNYTSTYYHAKPKYYEYNPVNHDLAKYIQRDLSYAMRNSGGPYSFDGTYSDYIIYPNEGFSVLRNSKIPAVLIEGGFTTHHFESQRLTELLFNRIEAWGIFKGLCRFFKAGVPIIKSVVNIDSIRSDNKVINFIIEDSTNIDTNSVVVKFDSVRFNDYSFDTKNKLLKIDLSNITDGKHILKIDVKNTNGIHSFPFERKIFIIKNEHILGDN